MPIGHCNAVKKQELLPLFFFRAKKPERVVEPLPVSTLRMATMERESGRRVVPRGTHYCCVCRCYRGKIVSGRKVSLHKFHANDKLRRVWIQRVKTVMKTGFKVSPNGRLCSEHFQGKAGPKPPFITLPSLFPTKEFTHSAVSYCCYQCDFRSMNSYQFTIKSIYKTHDSS